LAYGRTEEMGFAPGDVIVFVRINPKIGFVPPELGLFGQTGLALFCDGLGAIAVGSPLAAGATRAFLAVTLSNLHESNSPARSAVFLSCAGK